MASDASSRSSYTIAKSVIANHDDLECQHFALLLSPANIVEMLASSITTSDSLRSWNRLNRAIRTARRFLCGSTAITHKASPVISQR